MGDQVAPRSGWASLHWVKRWLYRGDRAGATARLLNRFWGRRYASGGRLARARDVQLEVLGRRSGRPVAFPIVLADLDGHWYAVSMLGENAQWVRNVRADGGRAVIRHGVARQVRLVEITVEGRAAILKRYVEVAPGARPHVAVDRREPVAAFVSIAATHPVFRVDALDETPRGSHL